MKIISTSKVYQGFLSILKMKLETSDGQIIEREVMSRSNDKRSDDAVSALVYDTNKDEFIFVKQFRNGLYREDDQHLVEVVAGTLENGEDPKECIIREIEEEIGYKTDKLIPIDFGYTSPGGTSEKIYLYIAYVSEQISEGGGLDSEHEEIEIVKMKYEKMISYKFNDLKTKLLVKEWYIEKLINWLEDYH